MQKASADIILLQKSLIVLHDGVLEGRKVFSNILKYVRMGARSNFGNMFSVIGASAWLPFVPMAAVQAIRQQSPSSIVVATPVASDSACLAVRQIADVCITLLMPEPLYGIGMYYADFSQTTDDEVLTLLQHTVHQPAQSVAS